uniref:Ig-like domain-containing protein n=1 Tax=Xiphophorus couchianus TaxID=32473 RepID=A0A3B5MMK3_9TELE
YILQPKSSVCFRGNVLRAAAVCPTHLVLCCLSDPEAVDVESGVESVKLPCRIRENLDGDVTVEWRDGDGRMVHVYPNGSDQPREQNSTESEEQDDFYKDRTMMDENLLKAGNFSLTLSRPTDKDSNVYTCRVSSGDGNLTARRVWLKVKGHSIDQYSIVGLCSVIEGLPVLIRLSLSQLLSFD